MAPFSMIKNKLLSQILCVVIYIISFYVAFILTPEVSSKITLDKKKLLKTATTMEKDIYLKEMKNFAKKYKKWLLIGSVILKIKKKLLNRSVLISSKGKIN